MASVNKLSVPTPEEEALEEGFDFIDVLDFLGSITPIGMAIGGARKGLKSLLGSGSFKETVEALGRELDVGPTQTKAASDAVAREFGERFGDVPEDQLIKSVRDEAGELVTLFTTQIREREALQEFMSRTGLDLDGVIEMGKMARQRFVDALAEARRRGQEIAREKGLSFDEEFDLIRKLQTEARKALPRDARSADKSLERLGRVASRVKLGGKVKQGPPRAREQGLGGIPSDALKKELGL